MVETSKEELTLDVPLLTDDEPSIPPTSVEKEEDINVGDYSEVREFRDAKHVFTEEAKKLWAIAAPITFNILCLYGINSTTQIFAGHLGNLQLSAVAIGLSVVSNFSFGFLLGMGSALETLCGQAFGAGHVHMLGVYMQRSWIILLVSAFLMVPVYYFATPILVLIGQEQSIADLAGQFTTGIIPQLFALALNFPAQKFLQAQSKVGVMAWIGFVALPFHILLLYLFIYVINWGIWGAAMAYNITSWAVSIAQIVYIVGWCKDSWTGFSSAAFKDMWAFVQLSVASAVMLCLELWYTMILVVLTGNLENAEIAVGSISICMNINGWEAMVFIGINAAVSVRVSNELGKKRPRATKYSIVVAVLVALLIGIACMAGILISRNHFAVIFTGDKEMQRAVAKIAYLLGVTMLLNSVQPTISGVAVGGGWQALVAYINLGCYYAFGLPLGFLLGNYYNFGVQGIWVGMLFGTLAQTIFLLVVVWRTDWKLEAAQASSRVKEWAGDSAAVAADNDETENIQV